ncbi:hypothetical protein [Flavobacterium lindanitolerans]|uniref:hypothetical protein n=1 Tax=Flavobacterium lindanitolerans TaxID=428988 RepID=UPI00280B2A87|nr:hypothetical protein [Flavobacterium lindanitolerans]
MKRVSYYRTVFQRRNPVKDYILHLFLGSTSFARLIIEVFIRKNMGRRYFKFSGAIVTAFGLMTLPFFPLLINMFVPAYFGYGFWGTIKEYSLWYVFVGVFLYFSYLRYKDIKHIRSLFDYEHFSLSTGIVIEPFRNLKFRGKQISIRIREIFIEPLPFFISGLILMLLGQKLLGGLFVFSSIVYCISSARAYAEGDDYMLDLIDEIICNKELVRTFVSDEETRHGFQFYGDKPSSKKLRDDMVHEMVDDDDYFAEAV